MRKDTEPAVPETLEELSGYIIYAGQRAEALNAEIRALERMGAEQALINQKKREAAAVGENLLDAQTRTGVLTKAIGINASSGANGQYRSRRAANAKLAFISQLGLSLAQVEEFERLADNPEAVGMAKAQARQRGRAVTRAAALKAIGEKRAERAQQDDYAERVIPVSPQPSFDGWRPVDTQQRVKTERAVKRLAAELENGFDIEDYALALERKSREDIAETLRNAEVIARAMKDIIDAAGEI